MKQPTILYHPILQKKCKLIAVVNRGVYLQPLDSSPHSAESSFVPFPEYRSSDDKLDTQQLIEINNEESN